MTSEIARVSPLLTVFSGPAGGIAGTISLGEATGRSSLISFDVGGTSLDACVIVDGAPTEVYEARSRACRSAYRSSTSVPSEPAEGPSPGWTRDS